VRTHYTVGFSTPLSERFEFNMAFLYAPNEKVHGTNMNTGPQTGFLEMTQYELIMGLGMKF
jgi:long-chain fatty acid transport protein